MAARGTTLAPAQAYPAAPIEEALKEKSKPSGGWRCRDSVCVHVQAGRARPPPSAPRRHAAHIASRAAGLSRADEDSPSKFAEALLGKEANSKSLQQFLQHGHEVLRFYLLQDAAEGPEPGDRWVGAGAMQWEGKQGAAALHSSQGGSSWHGSARPETGLARFSPRRRNYKMHFFVVRAERGWAGVAGSWPTAHRSQCRHYVFHPRPLTLTLPPLTLLLSPVPPQADNTVGAAAGGSRSARAPAPAPAPSRRPPTAR